MDNWGNWVMLSVPLYFALTNNLTGRAKGQALWAYFWLIAAFNAFNTWHFSTTWHATEPDGYPLPARFAAQYAQTLWFGNVVTVAMLIIPVVWYYHDRRKERVAGQASQTV